KAGQEATDTFSTKAAAESWARAQETAFEQGVFVAPKGGTGAILADLIDGFLAHRKRIQRPPGKTFANGLARLRRKHGLTHAGNLTYAFWRKHALDRISQR